MDALAPFSRDVLTRWKQALRGLGLDASDFADPAQQNFAAAAAQLRKSTWASIRRSARERGRRLAERGASLEAVLAGLNRLLEISLPYLTRAGPARASRILPLTRLHAFLALMFVAGYTGQPVERHQTLAESSAGEAQHRSRGASAYVTRVYEHERRRMSHDLHDEVGHDLILLKLYLEMIRLALKKEGAPAIEPRLNDAISIVSHAIDSVRRLILDLGPAVFEELGFLPAVKSYADQFSSRTKINVTVQEGYLPEDVPLSHQVALYRLMQGALSNVLKHSHARNVRISLGSMNDSVLIMVIEDDGVGFDTRAKPGRRSFGLTAMRERVEVLGGRIHVHSKRANVRGRKHGTRIEVDLPLRGTRAEDVG
ncbi:MAG TPA: sensor histidine kinase [Bryobacteraceae bacterium]|nr:sensor histidine kinase [Bryobacteraceae bacterium]